MEMFGRLLLCGESGRIHRGTNDEIGTMSTDYPLVFVHFSILRSVSGF